MPPAAVAQPFSRGASAVVDSRAELMAILATMREVLEHALEKAGAARKTTGACLYGALLAQAAISKFTPLTAVIRGGGPLEGPCLGYYDGRDWQGHYWVEVLQADTPLAVADLTADQFGGPPVQLLGWADAQARYRAGNQAEVDAVLREEHRDLASAP